MPGGEYVQFGCGYSVAEGWLNFDASPTARLEKTPLVGAFLGRLSGSPGAFPKAVRFGDVVRGLPVPDNSAAGLYASHVLEHLALDDLRKALREAFRVLRPGGVFRLIVPDLLSRASAYVAAAGAGDPKASHVFLKDSLLGQDRRARSLRDRAKAMFGNTAHLWMWDEHSMTAELKQAGFAQIRRAAFGDAEDPMFRRVENPERFVDGRHVEVALEARKPA